MQAEPPLDAFARGYRQGAPQVVWTRIADDVDTAVGALLKFGRDRPNTALLESVEGGNWRGRFSIIATDPDLLWRVRGNSAEIAQGDDVAAQRFRALDDAPLTALRAVIAESALTLPDDLPPMAAGLFGYLGYAMAGLIEDVSTDAPDPVGAPDALLMRPTLVVIFDALKQEVTLVTPARPEDGVDAEAAYEAARARLLSGLETLAAPSPARPVADPRPLAIEPQASVSPEDYRAMVETTKSYIRAGDIFQAVPSVRYAAPFELPPFALYRALRRRNPSPFLYYLNFDDFAVVGSSPEILVRLRDGTVTVRPIAGTRPRGATPEEDAALEADLLADPKERAEHLMLLDLGRNDVGRVAEQGTVKVTESFAVERYSQVMHIVSNVEGQLKDGADAVDAFFAGFPAGTVSGAPKVRAMEIIAELETEARGVYAGGVGYISAAGDMDTCIALRTAVVKDGTMHVRAGGGVVFDSDPESERMETIHKASAVFKAAEEARRFV